jgi:hypothetical protein
MPLRTFRLQPRRLLRGGDSPLEEAAAFGLGRVSAEPVTDACELPRCVERRRIGSKIG